MDTQKPTHTLVLDTGAIIRNEPSVSTLINQSESLVTVPAIISEIKDAATRSRVETTLMPFLTLRTPSPASIKFVTDFARRSGDLAVLSKPDIQIIALTYEIECERNNGDWRLRRTPGQKGVNGAPPAKVDAAATTGEAAQDDSKTADAALEPTSEEPVAESSVDTELSPAEPSSTADEQTSPPSIASESATLDTAHISEATPSSQNEISAAMAQTSLDDSTAPPTADQIPGDPSAQNPAESQEDSESDGGGWITPSNLKKKQAEDANSSIKQAPEPKTMQVAVLTTDFAMQNVILQINLNLLSPSLARVKHLKTFVLRCHACFQVTKDMSKQFCPRCGQPSLTRVSCSTTANGEFKLHLKKNMQWNTRGDRYSIPKAVHGSPHGRIKGGGKGGWGNELMLAEDQKEYLRAVTQEKRTQQRNLMDEDYLPGILTGDRGRAGGRIRVGAGRNVNAKKR